MKLKYHFFYSLLLFIFFFSCSNNNAPKKQTVDRELSCEVIDLNNMINDDSVCLDYLIDTMAIIQLETTAESVLGDVRKVVFGNNYLYVLDSYNNGSVAIFDLKGNFVRRLVTGNGPGEISLAENLAFDIDKNELYVYQVSCINKYSAEGDYIDCIYVNDLFDDFIISDSSFYCVQNELRSLDRQFTVIHCDSNFNSRISFAINNSLLCLVFKFYLHSLYDGKLLISRPFDDIIYILNNEGVKPKYKLNYSSCKLDVDGISINDYENFHSICEHNKFYFIGSFLENSNYQIFIFSDGAHFNTVYRCKSSDKYLSCIFHKSTFSSIIRYGLYNCVYNDFFVNVYTPNSFFESKRNIYLSNPYLSSSDREVLLNLKEDDNPLIILYKLKDIPADTE